MLKQQDDILRQHFALFDLAQRVMRVLIPLFMLGFTITGSYCIFYCAQHIISTDTPLVVNGEQTTWPGTIGFIGMLLGILFFGNVILLTGLRKFRRSWVEQCERLRKVT